MSETDDTEEFFGEKSSQKKLSSKNIIQNDEVLYISTNVEIISDLLNNICQENKSKKQRQNFLFKSFINKNIPSISVKDYIFRLVKHSKINESTIIILLIYIDRICKINNFFLTYYNIHKLILASFIIAIKYNEDNYYSMIIYSKIGGVTITELNHLEIEFLKLIKFNLFIPEMLYNKYYNDLMSLKSDSEEYESDEDLYDIKNENDFMNNSKKTKI